MTTPKIGDNTQIDYAAEQTAQLERDYEHIALTTDSLIAEAAAMPLPITNSEEKGKVADLIKRLRDHTKLITGTHELEKLPHYRRGQAIDQWFFGQHDRLAKRDRKNRNGAADDLNAELTAYDVRMLAIEQEKRRLEAAEAARKAEVARLEQERLAREAEERRLAAERARKPETQAAKTAAAVAVEEQASAAAVEARVAEAAAEQAYIETLAKPADIMRERTAGGTLSTMGQEPYAEILNKADLDMAALWPFIKFEALQQALNAWARSTDYRTEMKGASVGRRAKSKVR